MRDKQQVISTISSIFPEAKVYAFGSRINGGARQYSDLDVAIDLGEAVPLIDLSKLEELFSNSDIPYKIDLVDFQRVSDEFKGVILSTSERWV